MNNIIIKKINKKKFEVLGYQQDSDGSNLLYTTTRSLTEAIEYFNKQFKRINWSYEIV